MKIGNISVGEVIDIGVTQPNQFYYCMYGGVPGIAMNNQYTEAYQYLQPDSIYQTMPSMESSFVGQVQAYLSRRAMANDFDTNSQYLSPGTSFGYGTKQNSEDAPYDKITEDFQTTPEGNFLSYKEFSFFPNVTTRYNTFWHTTLYTELMQHNILVAENENIPLGGGMTAIRGWVKALFSGQNLGSESNQYGNQPHSFVEGGIPFVKLRLPSSKKNGPGGPSIGTSENDFGFIDYYMLINTLAHTGLDEANLPPNQDLYEMLPLQGTAVQAVNDFLNAEVNQTSYSSNLVQTFKNILQNNNYLVPTIIADFREPVHSIDWEDMMHGGTDAIVQQLGYDDTLGEINPDTGQPNNPGLDLTIANQVYENMSLFAFPSQYNPNNELTKAPNYGWHPMSTENLSGKTDEELIIDYHRYIDSFAYTGNHPAFFTIDNLFLQDYDILGLLPTGANAVMVEAAFNDYNFLDNTQTEMMSILSSNDAAISPLDKQKLLIMLGRLQVYKYYSPSVYNRPDNANLSGVEQVLNNPESFWKNNTFFPGVHPTMHNGMSKWRDPSHHPHLYKPEFLIRMFGPLAPSGYVPKCGVNYTTYFNLGDEFVSGTAPTQYGNTNFTFNSGLSLGSIESVDSFLGYDASQTLSNIPAGFQLTEIDGVNILDLELWKLFYDGQNYCKRIETKISNVLEESFVIDEINSLMIPRIQYLSPAAYPDDDGLHLHPFMIGVNEMNAASAIPVQWNFPDMWLNVPTPGGFFDNSMNDDNSFNDIPYYDGPVGEHAIGPELSLQQNPELPPPLVDLNNTNKWRILRVKYIEPGSPEWNSAGPVSHMANHENPGGFSYNYSTSQGYWICVGVIGWSNHQNGLTGNWFPLMHGTAGAFSSQDFNFGQISTLNTNFNPDWDNAQDVNSNGSLTDDGFIYNTRLKQGEYYVFEMKPTGNSGFAQPYNWTGFDPLEVGPGYYDYTSVTGAMVGGISDAGMINPEMAFDLRHPSNFVTQWVNDSNILNPYEMRRFEFCHQIGMALKAWNSDTNPYVDYYYQHIVRFFNDFTKYNLENPLSGPDREYNPYLHGTDHPISTYFTTIRDFLTQLPEYNGGMSSYEISNWVEWLRGGCTEHFSNIPPIVYTQYSNADVIDEFGLFEMPTSQTIFREDGLGFFGRVIFNKDITFNNWWEFCTYLNNYPNLQTSVINYLSFNMNDTEGTQDDVIFYSDVPYIGNNGQFSINKGYYPSNPESPFPSGFGKGSEIYIYFNIDAGITTEAFGPAESPGFTSGTSFTSMINQLIHDGIEGQTIDIYPENTQGSGYYSREDGLLFLERSIRQGNPDYRVLQLIDFALQNNLMQQLSFFLPPSSSPDVQGDTINLPNDFETTLQLPIPTKAIGVFDGKVSAAAIKYNSQPYFAEKEDRGFLKENDKNLHSDNLFTQSINPTNTEYYFTMTDGDPTLASSTTTFDVAFGHINGSGSNGRNNSKGPSEAIYRQAANELLGNAEGAFFSLSQSLFDLGLVVNDLQQPEYMRTSNPTADEYVWILRAHGYKQQESVFDPFIKFNLSGSNSLNIGQTTQLRTDVSKRVVQSNGLTRYFLRPTENAPGSPYGNQKEGDGVFGYWYPEVGTAVFNPKIAQKHNGGNNNITTVVFDADRDEDKRHTGMAINGAFIGVRDYQNALKLVNNFKNYDGNYIENAVLKVNSPESEQLNMIACIRIKPDQFNFTTNPTRFIDLGSTGQYNTFPAAGTSTTPVNRETMKYDEGLGTTPTTYITHVDLYDNAGYRVATAKLSKPIKKDFNSAVVIKILLKDY